MLVGEVELSRVFEDEVLTLFPFWILVLQINSEAFDVFDPWRDTTTSSASNKDPQPSLSPPQLILQSFFSFPQSFPHLPASFPLLVPLLSCLFQFHSLFPLLVSFLSLPVLPILFSISLFLRLTATVPPASSLFSSFLLSLFPFLTLIPFFPIFSLFPFLYSSPLFLISFSLSLPIPLSFFPFFCSSLFFLLVLFLSSSPLLLHFLFCLFTSLHSSSFIMSSSHFPFFSPSLPSQFPSLLLVSFYLHLSPPCSLFFPFFLLLLFSFFANLFSLLPFILPILPLISFPPHTSLPPLVSLFPPLLLLPDLWKNTSVL